MTRTTEGRDPATSMSSLLARLQQFAEGLTPEEQAYLRARRSAGVTSMLSGPLRDKARQVAGTLNAEEAAQLRLLLRQAGVDSVNSEEADTRGHMIGAFNDGQGGKGRPAPVVGTSGGVPLGLQEVVNAVGFLAFTTGLFEGPGGLGGPAPQPGQP